MIELHLKDGSPVAVNPMLVMHITHQNEGCFLVSPYGHAVEVKESYLQVQKAFKRWAKGGAE